MKVYMLLEHAYQNCYYPKFAFYAESKGHAKNLAELWVKRNSNRNDTKIRLADNYEIEHHLENKKIYE